MKKSQVIHFIGIGGIGMSALARFYLAKGWKVSGSDIAGSEITDELAKQGISLFIGKHAKENLPRKLHRVIYSAAIPKNNPELKEAQSRLKKSDILRYAEALGELTREYCTIAIAGSHGKSTTTALVSLSLIAGGFDPTVIIGTKLKEFALNEVEGSNFRLGASSYLVIEADEYAKSFHQYTPDVAIITTVDKEHLDTYKTFSGVREGFVAFARRVKKGGVIILNQDDRGVQYVGQKLLLKRQKPEVAWYSLKHADQEKLASVLKIPGDHNVSNAIAALRTAEILGIKKEVALSALASYGGAWRRFEYMGEKNGAKVVSDYGHHPTEIKATLRATRQKFPTKRIWCIFQPHQYQRLFYLFDEFTRAFDDAHKLIFMDVYEVRGREEPRISKKVNSFLLARAVDARLRNDVHYFPYENDMLSFIKEYARPSDIIIFMGAGSIGELALRCVNSS